MAETKIEGHHMIIHESGYDLRPRAILLGRYPECSLLPRVCHFDPALYQSGTDFCFLAPTILIEGVAQRPLVSNSTLGWPNQWWYQFWRIFIRWSVKTLRVILCQNYPA